VWGVSQGTGRWLDYDVYVKSTPGESSFSGFEGWVNKTYPSQPKLIQWKDLSVVWQEPNGLLARLHTINNTYWNIPTVQLTAHNNLQLELTEELWIKNSQKKN